MPSERKKIAMEDTKISHNVSRPVYKDMLAERKMISVEDTAGMEGMLLIVL